MIIGLFGPSILILLLIVAAPEWYENLRSSREPTYGGVGLASWLCRLESALTKEDKQAARLAIQAMGTNALPYLLERVCYRDKGVRKLLYNVLEKVRPRDCPHDLAVRAPAVDGFEALGKLASPAIPDLESKLGSDPIPEAALALGAVGSNALPALLRALRNKDPMVRACAAAGLRYLGSSARASSSLLVDLTDDRDSRVRTSAIMALSECAEQEVAIPIFVKHLKDQDDVARKTAVEALGKLGAGGAFAIPALEKLTHDRSDYVAVNARRALENIRLAQPLTN
jgi:HEAT repeat protein